HEHDPARAGRAAGARGRGPGPAVAVAVGPAGAGGPGGRPARPGGGRRSPDRTRNLFPVHPGGGFRYRCSIPVPPAAPTRRPDAYRPGVPMSRLTVVLSQAPGKHPAKRALEEGIVAALILETGLEVSVVPNLYDLSPDHTGRLFLGSVKGDMVV